MTFGTYSTQFANGPQGGIYSYQTHEDGSISHQKLISYYEPGSYQQMANCVKEGNLCYQYQENDGNTKYVMMSAKDAERLKLGKPKLLTRGLDTFKELNRGDAVLGQRPDKALGALNKGSSGGIHATPPTAKKPASKLSVPPSPQIKTDPLSAVQSGLGSVGTGTQDSGKRQLNVKSNGDSTAANQDKSEDKGKVSLSQKITTLNTKIDQAFQTSVQDERETLLQEAKDISLDLQKIQNDPNASIQDREDAKNALNGYDKRLKDEEAEEGKTETQGNATKTDPNSKTDAPPPWMVAAFDLSKKDPVVGQLFRIGIKVFGENSSPTLIRILDGKKRLAQGAGIAA